MPTANHWQNNHRTAEGRHHTCSGNTANMCGTGIGHRSSNTCLRKSFEEDNSECPLLVDADNAFNKLNRKVSLENIKRLCPPCTHTYTSYNTPAMLYLENGDHILSQEGATQGDNGLWQCMPYPHDH